MLTVNKPKRPDFFYKLIYRIFKIYDWVGGGHKKI